MTRLGVLLCLVAIAACSPLSSPADRQLFDALTHGDHDQVRAALAADARPDATYGRTGLRPLSIAVLRNDHANVRQLLAAGANPNFVHRLRSDVSLVRAHSTPPDLVTGLSHPELVAGMSLLSLAADDEMVRTLIDGGAEPNIRDGLQATPLALAAKDGDVGRIRILVRSGADVNGECSRGTPLFYALQSGRVEAIRELVAAGADPARTNWRGRTALHEAALIPSGAAIPALLEAGLYIDARDGDGRTPLILAALEGYDRAVVVLLDGGADVSVKDYGGRTALDWAVQKQRSDIAARLRGGSANAVDQEKR